MATALRTILGALALAACQAEAPPAPALPKGDETLPGDIEPVGFAHCDAARLELVAIVLGGPPKGAALEDVTDATAPGCTWVAAEGGARVRLNVYDDTIFPALRVSGPAAQFAALARAYPGEGATTLEGLGDHATRYGFTTQGPMTGAIVVQTPTSVLEFKGDQVAPAKLLIFAQSVAEQLEKPPP
jgi:hypothetical protein